MRSVSTPSKRPAAHCIATAVLLLASTLAMTAQTVANREIATTSAGNTMARPAGWHEVTHGDMLLFEAPEGDLAMAVVEVGKAADAKSAAQMAWAKFRPSDRHTVTLMTTRPGRQGWDERAAVDYDTSAQEHLELDVTALRHQDHWTVLIVDGSQATAEKRYAAIALLSQSLRPAGYQPESFAGRTPHRLDAARIEALRTFVQTSAAELGIPGLSIALVDHGSVLLEQGFGVKNVDDRAPVDAKTLFLIASNTKGLTTLLLAKLVDQHKLEWNELVTSVYPPFRLGDASTTATVKIRDLVCACTGLPRKDFEWIFNTPPTMPAAETFKQLAVTKPTSNFGETFQYNNQMAAAAGYIAGHIVYPKLEAGAAYDLAMKKEIFDPLRMEDTTFSFTKAMAENFASPHNLDLNGRTVVSDMAFDEIVIPFRPAGGAWSSAHDLIRYVELEVNKGLLPDGHRFISEQNLLMRRRRGVPTGENQWYGMGLWEDATWGISVIHHGGNMPGYHSDILIVPDAEVGAVILTNAESGSRLLRPFRRRLLELLYDGKPEAAEDVTASAASIRAENTQERARLTLPADPAVVAALARHYTNPELGTLEITRQNGTDTLLFNSAVSRFATRKSDDGTVSLVTTSPGIEGFEFVVGQANGHSTLTTRDGQHVYTFYSK